MMNDDGGLGLCEIRGFGSANKGWNEFVYSCKVVKGKTCQDFLWFCVLEV